MDVGLFSRAKTNDDEELFERPSTRRAIAALDLRIQELEDAYARVAPILDSLPSLTGETDHDERD